MKAEGEMRKAEGRRAFMKAEGEMRNAEWRRAFNYDFCDLVIATSKAMISEQSLLILSN